MAVLMKFKVAEVKNWPFYFLIDRQSVEGRKMCVVVVSFSLMKSVTTDSVMSDGSVFWYGCCFILLFRRKEWWG